MSRDPESTLQALVLYAVNLLFLILLLVCGANVATLVFARTATREAEITVRTALGASRGRICAQLFAEALVMTAAAASAGLLAGSVAVEWATAIFFDVAAGTSLPFWWDHGLSWTTIGYAATLAVLAALIVGVVPALKATNASLQGRLREAGAAGAGMKFGSLWTGIIVSQVALTMMLLLSVFSLGYSAFSGLHAYDVTFERTHFLTARLDLDRMSPEGLGREEIARHEGERLRPAFAEMARRLAGNPRVAGVTYAKRIPGEGMDEFWLEFAEPEVAAGARLVSDVLWVRRSQIGPDYFDTFEQPLVAGRPFTQAEIEGGRPVAIVDETFVRLILGGRQAIGLMLREPPNEVSDTPGRWHEIVGVVKDITRKQVKRTSDAMIYTPAALGTTWPLHLIVHARGDASGLIPDVRQMAVAVDRTLQLTDVMTIDRLADDNRKTMTFFLSAFGAVASVALLLATAGIYALVSFTLARRTREIGIRMALGASRRRIITGVFARVFAQIGAGILAGAVPGLAIAAIGVEDAHGTGMSGGLAATLAIAVFVIVVALAACAVPLGRALRMRPVSALRAD
jgi:predicted permease